MQKRSLFAGWLLSLVAPTLLADSVDYAVLNRIVDEGLNRSQLPYTASYLTDRIGARLTNSPQMREAEQWTQEQYRRWGLRHVRAEAFPFGRGWFTERIDVRMLKPRELALRAIAMAWTPGTQGTLRAPIIVAPLWNDRDFAKWKGQLRGKIVLVSIPREGSEPTEAPFRRYTREELKTFDVYPQPKYSDAEQNKQLEWAVFEAKRDAYLVEEGALAWVRRSPQDGGVVQGDAYQFQVGQSPKLPGIELAAEDYRRLARLAVLGEVPTLEITSVVHYVDDDTNAYNILADIPGADPKAGYVMAGAHLDSWVAGDGAADNAAGSAVVMEAARILAKLELKPKRTIRFALWSAEEQGALGSMAYIERYLAYRPPVSDPKLAKINAVATWNTRWPIELKPGAQQLSVYFNVDNGSGKFRGIFTEGNIAVAPIFREWLAPFASMGATEVVANRTGGTDHVFMQHVGIPAFQFIQDPLDYMSRIHHSGLDTFDHLKMADLRQAAVILASMLWHSAQHDQLLPRMPVQQKPSNTDPFAYETDD